MSDTTAVDADALIAATELPEQVRVRRDKVQRMREAGVEPYLLGHPRTHGIAQLKGEHQGLEPDTRTGQIVSLVGRIMLKRDSGKLCFATIRDASGDTLPPDAGAVDADSGARSSIQIMVSLAEVGRESLDAWKRDIDLGDHVGVTGEVITSRRGELSVLVTGWSLTAKCLRPLPEKHKGLTDPEARVRQRYVDLIVNAEARQMVYTRARAVAAVRAALTARDFTEVETPMLQVVHGGANARPFRTHINAYDMPLYLRIAPELYLKRLLVGGIERVFEVNRNFRNEGADASHNPEFTMLEAYEAYGTYETMRDLTQDLILKAAVAAFGAPVARRMQPDGTVQEVDLSGPWPSITVHDAISGALGEQITPDTEVADLVRHCDRVGVHLQKGWGRGQIILEMYEHLVEHSTTMPTFYMDFPADVSPLTRAHRDDPRLAERWDLVAFGAEIGTAYSELIDPVEQRRRLTAQSLLAAKGDVEAMQLDEDFLRALEYAMPPAGGMGMGIDRLLMMLTGRSIRETVLFPLVKPDAV